MKDESSVNSVDKIRVFARAHPKVTKVEGGYIFDFTDVFSISRQQEVKATNATPEDLKKILGKDRMGISKIGGDDKQMKFPFFGE